MIYERIGVKPIICATGPITKVGGSIVDSSVIEAMNEAALYNVDIIELEKKVSNKIAKITNNEAAFICAGAASGIVLATAACMAGKDKYKIQKLPDSSDMKNEVIVHQSHHNPYELQVCQAGAKLKSIGYNNETHTWQLEGAFNENTAAVMYFFFRGGYRIRGAALPLEKVIKISHDKGIPVIVNAAAQIPPVENLWKYTNMGADLVIFSGGKGLKGPQGSGLVFGKTELIEACRLNASPNYAIGRSMKVTKEEIVGLLIAVERYIKSDHIAIESQWDSQIQKCINAFEKINGINAFKDFYNGQPIPICKVKFNKIRQKSILKIIIDKLKKWDPPIFARGDTDDEDVLIINPSAMQLGQEEIIINAIEQIFKQINVN